jgi:hypothetical protein
MSTSSEGITVLILSANASLVDGVRHAVAERYATRVVDTWEALEAALEPEPGGVVLLDAERLGASSEQRLADLTRHRARWVALVAVSRAAADRLIELLYDRTIHRLLIMPPAPAITRVLIESAVARHRQLRSAAVEPPSGQARARVERRARESAVERLSRARPSSAWIASLGLLAVGGVAGVLWQSSAPNAESSGAAPVTDQRFAELLARGRQAFLEGRLTEPSGDSALDYYLTIAAASPEHREASEQLAVVAATLFAQAEAALLADSLEAAEAALEHARRVEPESARLAFLETQLGHARERLAAAGVAGRSAFVGRAPQAVAAAQGIATPPHD